MGSRGYIGSRLSDRLAAEDVDVFRVSSTDGTGIDPVTGLLPGDFRCPDKTDVVVYLAQSPYFRMMPEHSSHLMAVNCLSAVRAANAARKAGVGRFIYVSTGTVYAPSFSTLTEASETRRDDWYALSKLHAEEALALFRPDLEICNVRPFGVYGPGQSGRLIQNLQQCVCEGKPITLQPARHESGEAGGLKISLCYIDDAIEVFMALIRSGGPATLNLAGNEALSIRAIGDAIGRISGLLPSYSISTAHRGGDYVANIDLLLQTVPLRFTPFENGLAASISLPAKALGPGA